MKKRVFSFVIMVVTLIAVIVLGVPNIGNNSKVGMEFNGGFDILYEVASEKDSSDDLATVAAHGIEKRLDISNTIDPIVSVEGDKYVRVTVSASSQLVADDIRSIIENNAEISFRDFENNLLATGEEILEDVGATLSSEVDYNGNPIILLNIKDTDLLADITGKVSSLSDQHLVVWLGYEEGDDYANLESDASVAKKIIYNATVSNKLDSETITITGNFSKSSAQSTVDLINSGTLDYDLNLVQISTIDTDYAESSYNKILIAGSVAVVLVIVFLCVNYKLGGLVSSLSLVFNVFLTVTLFVAFKGIFNQQAIAALIVSMGIAVDAIVVLFERVNSELYGGKNLERALNEGYKKSIYSIVDANVVVLIMSIVMFFLGNSVANFALMLALSSVCSLVVITIINKLLLNYLVKINSNSAAFGAKKEYLENKESYLNRKIVKTNPLSVSKKYFMWSGIAASVSLVLMLILQLAAGSMFNYNNTVRDNSNITIISSKEYFTDDEHIKEFFRQEGIELEVKNIKNTTFEDGDTTKYKVVVSTDDSVVAVEDELTNKIIDVFGENKEYDERYELYINDINPKSTLVSLLNALYTTGIGLLIIGVYLAIRYRYSYAISAIVSTIATITLTALVFGLTRIPVGSDSIIAIFAIAVFSVNTLIITFSRQKEMLGNNGKKYISNDERKEVVQKSIIATLPRLVVTTLATIVASLALLVFATANNYSFYIALILGLVLNVVNTLIISSQLWLLLERRSDKIKRTFKPKKTNSKFKELDEQVFIGIND